MAPPLSILRSRSRPRDHREDCGPHLPFDVDNYLIWSICEEAAHRAGGEILLPLIPFGFETHHIKTPEQEVVTPV
jgi:creatinine amidohydrolase/Fe(II)-dependent formamide hydrolase-like protein